MAVKLDFFFPVQNRCCHCKLIVGIPRTQWGCKFSSRPLCCSCSCCTPLCCTALLTVRGRLSGKGEESLKPEKEAKKSHGANEDMSARLQIQAYPWWMACWMISWDPNTFTAYKGSQIKKKTTPEPKTLYVCASEPYGLLNHFLNVSYLPMALSMESYVSRSGQWNWNRHWKIKHWINLESF